MENNEMMPTNKAIKQELLEILNKPEILSSFNEVLEKYGISANKTITVEFKFFDTTQVQTPDTSQDREALSIPLTGELLKFGSLWCPSCPPPPGKFI